MLSTSAAADARRVSLENDVIRNSVNKSINHWLLVTKKVEESMQKRARGSLYVQVLRSDVEVEETRLQGAITETDEAKGGAVLIRLVHFFMQKRKRWQNARGKEDKKLEVQTKTPKNGYFNIPSF